MKPFLKALWRRGCEKELAVVLLLPVVLSLISPNAFFPDGPWIDSWFYTGCFLNLPHHLQEFDGTYYVTRLPWILPGFLAHRLFSPVTAHLVLHLTFYYGLLLATYFLGKTVGGPRTGLLSAILMAFCPWIVAALGWDYVDGAGIVFSVIGLAALERGLTSPRSFLWLACHGAFLACAVFTNLFLIALGPVFALHYWLRRPRDRARIYRDVLAVVTGFISATAIFGLANSLLGGRFLFFMPSIEYARAAAGQVNPWRSHDLSWLFGAEWLVLPAIAMIGALVACIKERKSLLRHPIGLRLASQVDLLIVISIWCYAEWKGQPTLQFSYYSSYLVPWAVLALAFQAGSLVDSLRRPVFFGIIGGAIGFFTLPFALDSMQAWETISKYWPLSQLSASSPNFHSWITFLSLGAGVVAMFGIWLRVSKSAGLAIFLGFIGVVFAFEKISHQLHEDGAAESMRAFQSTAMSDGKTRHRLVCEAHGFVQGQASDKELRFWYDGKSALGQMVLRGISSTYMWGYRLLSEKYPVITVEGARSLDANTRLVLMLPDDEVPPGLEAEFLQIGWKLSPVANARFSGRNVAFHIWLYDLIALPVILPEGLVHAMSDGKVATLLNLTEKEISGDRLESNLYSRSKSVRAKQLEARNGQFVFQPMTAKDHVATEFCALADPVSSAATSWALAEFEFSAILPDSQRGMFSLQDQDFNILGKAYAPFADTQVRMVVVLRSSTKSVRLMIAGKPGFSCILPNHIRILQVTESKRTN